jgi:hypothetical protein
MIVYNFDVRSAAGIPAKTDSPLPVDPNAELSGSIPGKFLQAVQVPFPCLTSDDFRCTKVAALPRMHLGVLPLSGHYKNLSKLELANIAPDVTVPK